VTSSAIEGGGRGEDRWCDDCTALAVSRGWWGGGVEVRQKPEEEGEAEGDGQWRSMGGRRSKGARKTINGSRSHTPPIA
jgi:hypothetical protein